MNGTKMKVTWTFSNTLEWPTDKPNILYNFM